MKIILNQEQAKVLEVIKEKRHFGIFFDMGVGKTAVILSLIEHIVFDKLEMSRVLILAPATVANKVEVWQDEIKKWENYNYFDYFDLRGTEKERIKKLQQNKSSITIMSDSLLLWWHEKYGNLDMFDMIVIDESSRFKSNKAKKFKRLSSMINLQKHRVYELSGTPTPNGYQDIWSQMFLLDKGERLGKSYWKFIDRYFMTFGYKKYLSKINKQKIMDSIKDICVFASSANIVLPPKIEQKICFEFTPQKQKIMNDFKNEYVLELQQKEITVLSKQILINKCLQLANGCVYYNKQGEYQVFDNTKLNFVKKYSEEHPDENILVFYSFKFDKKRLLELPRAEEISDVTSKNKWVAGKIKLGIISPYSFQYGGNLQSGGHTIIWFGLLWGLENYLQSNKRIWRQGQKKEVKIMYLIMNNTWDEYVYKCVISKEKTQNEFLNEIDIVKGGYNEKGEN